MTVAVLVTSFLCDSVTERVNDRLLPAMSVSFWTTSYVPAGWTFPELVRPFQEYEDAPERVARVTSFTRLPSLL